MSNEINMLFLGKTGSGKTTIINKINKENNNNFTDVVEPTMGF